MIAVIFEAQPRPDKKAPISTRLNGCGRYWLRSMVFSR
jgi:hypothetical protein